MKKISDPILEYVSNPLRFSILYISGTWLFREHLHFHKAAYFSVEIWKQKKIEQKLSSMWLSKFEFHVIHGKSINEGQNNFRVLVTKLKGIMLFVNEVTLFMKLKFCWEFLSSSFYPISPYYMPNICVLK